MATSPIPDVVCNIKTGVATGVGAGTCASPHATCNGVADDSAAFAAFNTWAVSTWQASHVGLIQLLIPPGSFCIQTLGNQVRFVDGIKNLFVLGNNATLGNPGGAGDNWYLGSIGIQNDTAHRGLIATVSAGASSVTLLTSSDNSKFTVGQWALVAGFDMQGSGYPPNPAFFEYVLITGKSGASSEIIQFSAPLTKSYKSTWPDYDPQQMGPAAIWVLPPTWDLDAEFYGLTISSSAQVYAPGRNVVFQGVTFDAQGGSDSVTPSLNGRMAIYNSSCSTCTMEVDKTIANLQFDHSTWHRILYQSPSVNLTTMTNSTVSDTWFGTGLKTIISNSTINNFGPGATVTGASGEIICTNCVINTFTSEGTGSGAIPSVSVYNYANGVFSWANSLKTQNWPYPGGNMMFRGTKQEQGPVFQITDVTQDATNTYVSTTLSAAALSDIPHYGNNISIRTHPAPKFTCTNCTGVAGLAVTNAPAGSPWGSYFQRTFPGGNYTEFPYLWGPLASVNVNVTNAYTGGLSPVFYFVFPGVLFPNGTTDATWNPQINPKITGGGVARIVTPTTVTGNQSGDSLVAPGVGAFIGGSTMKPTYNIDLTGDPVSATVTVQTNQGVVYP